MSALVVDRFELPPVPAPQPGDAPFFNWDTVARIQAAEIISEVRRFAYWNEIDNLPLEIGYEAFIEGLPETAGIADVVVTHPGVLADLSEVSRVAAQILREVARA